MNNQVLAQKISNISKRESSLLYYFPEEVADALAENRSIILQENGKLVAFGLWHIYGDWIEISTLYVRPESRGKGYLRQLIAGMYEKLKNKKDNFLIFTQVPQVVKVAGSYSFQQASYHSLPLPILLKIISHRAHPRRWLSFLIKHLGNIPRVFRTKLYVRISDGG